MPPVNFHHILIEIAAKVVQRVHIEHQAFFFPDVWRNYQTLDTGNLRILCNDGIQAAFETAVTASIATEFKLHRAISGWARDANNKSRTYEIESEKRYKDVNGNHDGSESVDLCARRTEPTDTARKHKQLLIEAKCAQKWKYDGPNRRASGGHRDFVGIAKDAKFMAKFAASCSDCYCWLLIWGVEQRGQTDAATKFWRNLNKSSGLTSRTDAQVDVKRALARWVPIFWESKGRKLPKIKSWIWVSMAEINLSAKRN